MKREQVNKISFLARPRRGLGKITFLKNRDGATAIEFAMVGIPFLGLLCAIFQTGLVYFEAAQLQEATQTASRAILTQSAAAGMTYRTFLHTYACGQMSGMFTCDNLRADVQSPATWTAADALDAGTFYNNANNTLDSTITMPAAGNIAVVRILYPMSQMAAIIGGTALQAGSIAPVTAGQTVINGQSVTLLMGIYAFRVEP
ncbi:MAG: TadE/TadG family type IV pilus assembly protein [Methylocystis sp.]